MKARPFTISFVLVVGVITTARAAQTNALTAPMPPRAPHWYQTVTNGVTLRYLTPVSYFRGVLGMTPSERDRVLAGKSPAERKAIMAKVSEYEALPKEVREARLFQTELHWYMLTLLRLEPAQRAARLKDISPLYQPALMTQLSEWDRLPDSLRQTLLEKETFLRTYVQWQGQLPSTQEDLLSRLPAARKAAWTEELSRWQKLPEDQRQAMCGAFQRFFSSTRARQKETIQALSDDERRQMEQALQSYAKLPPNQQRVCVQSFGKFATMSTEERGQFLQNAAKWETMTPSERELWGALVNHLPPMPPDFFSNLPPMPPGWPGHWPLAPNTMASQH